ncbi:MAG TPA: hypothetical protein VM889_09460 [Candidatus Thermoplasmatota archaeon]|nr:hypothetical protein [Candidatus Thermoplasmatota archaeon]
MLVKGNDFQDNVWHARIQLHHVEPVPDTPFSRVVLTGTLRLEDNRFGDASWGGATISAANATAVGNRFEGANAWLALRAHHGSAVGNWWGHPSGPSGAGTGDGNRYAPYGANLAYEPWLAEAPAFERVGCGG